MMVILVLTLVRVTVLGKHPRVHVVALCAAEAVAATGRSDLLTPKLILVVVCKKLDGMMNRPLPLTSIQLASRESSKLILAIHRLFRRRDGFGLSLYPTRLRLIVSFNTALSAIDSWDAATRPTSMAMVRLLLRVGFLRVASLTS